MSQLDLFSPPKPQPKPLTDLQQEALDFVKTAGHEGVSADELGAEICARRSKHDAGSRCRWCASNGKDMLTTLRAKGHVKSRRGAGWYALELPPEPTNDQDIPY